MELTLNTPILTSQLVNLGTSGNDKADKLHKAAQQFEALLVHEMLKATHQAGSDGWLGSGESTGDDSAMDMAESQLANALSSGRGIGLASVIEREMTRSIANKAGTDPAQNTAVTDPANSAGSAKEP